MEWKKSKTPASQPGFGNYEKERLKPWLSRVFWQPAFYQRALLPKRGKRSTRVASEFRLGHQDGLRLPRTCGQERRFWYGQLGSGSKTCFSPGVELKAPLTEYVALHNIYCNATDTWPALG